MRTTIACLALFLTLSAACGDDGSATSETPPVVAEPEAAGDNCPTGGSKVTITEHGTSQTFYVCNGASGAIGANGTDGTNGTDGQTGPAGQDGQSITLLEQATVQVGDPNCPNGGTVLFLSGVPYPVYACNGTNGTNGVDGTNGTDGETGPAGPIGETGPTGPTGPAGSDGTITVVNDPGAAVSCTGTIINGRRVSYKAQTYSNGLIFAFATVEVNSNSASGFALFATDSENRSTAPVSVFSSGGDYFEVAADRTVPGTLTVTLVSGEVRTPVTVTDMVCGAI